MTPINYYHLMTLSLNCKDVGDPVCTHTMYGETEEELLQNAKKHGIEVQLAIVLILRIIIESMVRARKSRARLLIVSKE
ncbi:MAG: hypothetical protein WBQ25_19010 [Nitrososphaeraceae archaeon]